MENFDYQNRFPCWRDSPVILPRSQPSYVRDVPIPPNNGIVFSEYIPDDFASGEDNFDPFVVPTAQDSYQRQETGAAEGLEMLEKIQSHSLPTDTVGSEFNTSYSEYENTPALHEYDLLDGIDESEYENTLALHDYDLLDSSVSSTASASINNFDFCDEFNANFPIFLSNTNSPTFGNYPHNYGSPNTFESTDTSPATALGTVDSSSEPISTYPIYDDHPESPYNDVGNTIPSNTSFPYDTSSQSTLNDGYWSEALSDFFSLFEVEPAVDGTNREKDLDFHAGQDASSVTIVPAENENMDDSNPQWTWNDQSTWVESTWAVDSFYEEGIARLTNKFDRDTEAGPSTGSSVAASMLGIEQAKHGQRDDWAASVSAAPEKQKGKGKRKAIDAPEPPEPPPPSKKLRVDPSAQTMGSIISTQPAPYFTICLDGLNQMDSWKFVHVSGGGERLPSLSSEEPTYMTLKHKDDGELEARDMVSARDSHARRLQKENRSVGEFSQIIL